MAEKFYDYASYSYGQNNPIGNIDVGGRFVFKDASKYPELSRLLQNIHKVLDNSSIMNGLQKFSGLDPQIIRQQFMPGIGPEIKADPNLIYQDRVGSTSIDGKTIKIDHTKLQHLEDALKSGNIEGYNDYLSYIILIILHEYTHSGDLQIDGERSDKDQPDENCLGYQFEKEVFGTKMKGIDDVRKYLRERDNFVEQENKDSQKKNTGFWNTVMNLGTGTYHVTNGQIVKD
jgi:hypothetical protein